MHFIRRILRGFDDAGVARIEWRAMPRKCDVQRTELCKQQEGQESHGKKIVRAQTDRTTTTQKLQALKSGQGQGQGRKG